MSDIDLDAIEARANAGVRQTPADADVLALVARVRELEDEMGRVRQVADWLDGIATEMAIRMHDPVRLQRTAESHLMSNVSSASSRSMGGDLR